MVPTMLKIFFFLIYIHEIKTSFFRTKKKAFRIHNYSHIGYHILKKHSSIIELPQTILNTSHYDDTISTYYCTML